MRLLRSKILLGTGLLGLAVGGAAYGWGESLDGRMTGGGKFDCGEAAFDVTHGFELHCDPRDVPNNLEINWPDNRFHLTTLTDATCINDPSFSPNPPAAPFNTYVGEGTGKLNGVSGAEVYFTMTDHGEPGVGRDTIKVKIVDAAGNTVLDCPTVTLEGGNQQAHPDNK